MASKPAGSDIRRSLKTVMYPLNSSADTLACRHAGNVCVTVVWGSLRMHVHPHIHACMLLRTRRRRHPGVYVCDCVHADVGIQACMYVCDCCTSIHAVSKCNAVMLCLYVAAHIDTDLQAFGNEPEEGGEGHAPKRRALRLDKRVALDYLCVRVCVSVRACMHACSYVCIYSIHACKQACSITAGVPSARRCATETRFVGT